MANCREYDEIIEPMDESEAYTEAGFLNLAERYGLSHRAFARRFGIPYRTIEDWSRGVRIPPAYVIEMAAELLERDVAEQKREGKKMSRTYYVSRGDFGNVYGLRYTESADYPVPAGWERITRKEAEDLARAEARRRKDEPMSSGYADAYIYPFGMSDRDDDCFLARRGWHTEGRIAVRDNAQ